MSDNFDEDEIEEQDEQDAEETKGGAEDVMGLLKRMQQQLSFLEKKIDTLLSQSTQQPSQGSDRPRYNDRGFSRPPRPFGNSYGGDRGGPRSSSSDRGPSRDRGDYPPRGRSFDRPPRRDDSRGGSGGSSGGMGGGGGGFNRDKKKFFRGDRK